MKDLLKALKLNEGLLSAVLGVLIIASSIVLLTRYFRSVNTAPTQENTSSTSTEQTSSAPEEVVKPGEYEIKEGDSLWKISEDKYGTGNAWNQVYEANKEAIGSNPSRLAVGTKLNMPELKVTRQTEYTVQNGDSLWNISAQLCDSGYEWSKLATDNKLENPGVIHPGQVLQVTCNSVKISQLSSR